MISFPKLGNYGRLGNQLFQYAFLRSSANRLGTNFYCPKWDGDDIFDLCDESQRTSVPIGIRQLFDPAPESGFNDAAMSISDHTEIQGFFQSEHYYQDKNAVREWFDFKNQIKNRVADLYNPELVRQSVSLSLRIDGDYGHTREYFPLYPISYYEAALRKVNASATVLVFSDRPDLAIKFFKPLSRYALRFVTDLDGPSQLYLMTQCRANIITNSTFAWWGAWLNKRADRTVIVPSFWCRPGVPNSITGILCKDWIKIPGTVPIWDHFHLWRLRHPFATIKRIQARVL